LRRRTLPAPRWQTPLPVTVVGSWGPDVGRYVKRRLGLTLDRWQQRGLNRALAYDASMRLVHRHYLLSAGRQNGKTVGVRGLVGWALTADAMPEWSELLGLAHDKAQARRPYLRVRDDLLPLRRELGGAGGLALTRYLGIRSDMHGRHREYDVASREGADTIRSMSVDLAVFDEVRTQRSFAVWQALEPTFRARPDPLAFGISTAGDDRSVLLQSWWQRGVRIIDGAEPAAGFGMTWYAANDDDDPHSVEAVLRANPAAAEGRIPVAPILASARSLTPSAYRQETLNLWATGSDEWLPAGTWDARIGPQPELDGQRVVLGVDATPDWHRATVTAAVLTDAGVWVGVAGELDAARGDRASVAPDDLQRLTSALVRQWGAAGVAYSSAAAAAPYAQAAAEGARVAAIGLGPRQVRSASQLLRAELVGGRLTHPADPLLAQQVRQSRPSGPMEAGEWYISVRESVGPVDAIRAVAWSAWAAIAPADREMPLQVFI
jgi:hypothetical protein